MYYILLENAQSDGVLDYGVDMYVGVVLILPTGPISSEVPT